MRQVIIALSLLGSFAIYAMTVNLLETSVLFLLFGILPDTTERLSANQMLTIYSVAAISVLMVAFRGSTVSIIEAVRSLLHPTRSQAS